MSRTRTKLFALAVVAVAALVFSGCKKDGAAQAAGAEGDPAATTTAGESAGAAASADDHDHGHDHGHADEAAKAEPKAEPKAAKAEAHDDHEGHGHEEASGCASETVGRGPGGEAVPAGKTALGQPILHGGGDFTDAPEVSVEDLLADPDKWAGKTVQVTGDVSAMCHHRRGWFAVVAGDKSGQQVRVLTMPQFKVPAGSIGRTARAEGTVEVIEVPARHAKHLMKDHKLGDPAEVKSDTIKQVVVRATCADFVDVAAN